MMKTKRLLTSVLAGAMVLASAIPVFAAETDGTSDSNTSAVATVNSFDFISYGDYLAKYESAENGKKTVEIKGTDYDADGTDAAVSEAKNVYGDKEACLLVPVDGTARWKFEIPDAGLYNIEIVYAAVTKEGSNGETTSSTNNIERILNVNGEVPFLESRHLALKKSWSFNYTENNDGELRFETDGIGNELRPTLKFIGGWEDLTLFDTSTYYAEPFLYYFNKGENTISLYGIREDMYIKEIIVKAPEALPSYADVLKEYSSKGYAAADAEPIYINAETPAVVSSSTITPGYDRSSAISEPQSATTIKRKIIGGTNWTNTSDYVKYNFTVERDGLYSIVLRYKQDSVPGVFVSRAVMIDGEYPFAEAKNCRFDYKQDWQVGPLADSENEFQFYLSAGEHEITLTATVGEFGEILTRVNDISDQLNDDYLQIVKLTGAYPDDTRDYGFSRVMPDVIRNIARCADDLQDIVDTIGEMSGGKSQNTSTLETAILTLRAMGESERSIAENLGVMKSHVSSLSSWCSDLTSQPLQIDYIMVQSPDAELPKAAAGIMDSLKYELGQFFGSFYADYNTFKDDNNTDENVGTNGSIECWTSSGRDQATIIRDLTNSGFCKDTGISVSLKLVDGGALLPSILAGIGPDISLDASSPIDYAIRGAVLPLNDMENFDEVCKNFYPSALTSLSLYGKTYALPTTLEFNMMFVRNDIMAQLGLEVPKTWDDFLALIPVLEFNNMTVILPNDYKLFLYQRGGNVWDETSDNPLEHGWRTTLDDNLTLTAFTEMCNMYTQYSLLAQADFSTRFKTGVAPIGITSYSSYTTLTVFAPEIAGLWEMHTLPGTVQEDGSIDYTAIVSTVGISLLKGVDDADATWKFMCWYTGKDFQVDYCNELIALLGAAAKTTTANIDAMAEMPWSASEYAMLMDQYEHTVGIPSYPGNYVIDRYTGMAFNAAYNDGANPSEALLQYVNAANQEITRKRTEFNMPTYPGNNSDKSDATE